MANRRMTLGGLSSSQLNSRTSLGPARVVNKEEKKSKQRMSLAPDFGRGRPSTAPNGRPSLAPDSRRSSIFGLKPPAAKTDPRPVQDKSYLNSCIRTLITYLTAHGYDHSISPKLLTTPTSKEFTHIIQFLFRKVDPNLTFTGKIEDEVPLVFKKLQYPFSISKSSLYAVGSPHTWPSLLGALTWIVELLNYEEKAETAKAEAFDQDNNTKMFFDYVSKSYQHFLAGDDHNCAVLEENLARTFAERDGAAQEDVTRLEGENAQLEAEAMLLKNTPSPLEALVEKKAGLVEDLAKFQGVLASLKEHKVAMEKKIRERQADVAGKQAELSKAVAENTMMAERICGQQISAADMDKMRHDKSHQEDLLHRVQEQRAELDKKVYDQEAEVGAATEGLESNVSDYHDMAQELEILPETAKRAEKIAYAIDLNRDETILVPEEVAPVDFKGVIRPGLAKLKEDYAKRMREAGTELLALQEQQDVSDAALAEQREENGGLEEAVRGQEESLQRERERMETHVKSAGEKAAALKGELAQLKTYAATSLESSDVQVAELELELEEARRETAVEKEALNNTLLSAMSELMSFKDHVQATLRRVEDATERAVSEVKAAPEPSA